MSRIALHSFDYSKSREILRQLLYFDPLHSRKIV